MRTISLTILLILCVSTIITAQSGSYQPLKSFIPQGYSILNSATTEFNKDKYKDMVLVLEYKHGDSNVDTPRSVLILAGGPKKLYKLFASNDSVVLCKNCGGAFGDPYERIVAKGSYFSVEHYGGSSWRWSRIITFKYDSKTKKFRLHRDAGKSYHTSDPNKKTDIITNKQDFDKLDFSSYSYQKGQ